MTSGHDTPPRAKKIPKLLSAHGVDRHDPYYWMRNRDDPDLIQWLAAEREYYAAVMAPTNPLQEQLFEQLCRRIPQDDQSAPYPDRGYLWYRRTYDGLQYPRHFRAKIMAGNDSSASPDEQLVLDENELADGHEFCDVGELQISPNARYLAWAVDFVGRRFYEIQFRDLQSGQLLSTKIPNTTGNILFAEDNLHLLYTRQDPDTLRADRLYIHRLGTDASEDMLLYTEGDPQFNLYLMPTKSRQHIQCVSSQTLSSEVRLIDAHNPLGEPQLFWPREPNHEYSVDHLDGRFVVLTNWLAPNKRLMKVDRPGIDKLQWQELLAHDSQRFIEDFELLNDWLIVARRYEGLTELTYQHVHQTEWQSIELGQTCYCVELAAISQPNTDQVRYVLSSPTTPRSVIDYDLQTKRSIIVKQDRVLDGFDSDNYCCDRVWASSSDGARIPISVLYHRTTKIDGTAPMLIYGYGAYGINLDDDFSCSVLNLVDRGFVYATVHVRGGQELGRHWYDNGRLMHKQNSFTDFIDSTRFLIDQRYADPRQVFAQGGSAGGLLIGAVINMAAQLYRAVIVEVPFVDVVTTMQDDSIPLTTSEYEEWGDPHEEDAFRYMLSYSPYDNVCQQEYPHILVVSGFHDSQVQYWEPAKWVAKLRDCKMDKNLLLLDMEMHAGHGGASGRYDRYRELAKMQAFLLSLVEPIHG